MLPINVINEKIYVFVWFWLVALVTITGLHLVYHLLLLLSPATTSQIIKWRLRHKVSYQPTVLLINCGIVFLNNFGTKLEIQPI